MKRLIFIVCCAIVLQACSKAHVEGHFTVKGRLVQDCSEKPLSGHTLHVSFKYNTYYNENIGEAITDSAGYFSMSVENHGGGTYQLRETVNQLGSEPFGISALNGEKGIANGTIIDCQDVYYQVVYNGVVKVVIGNNYPSDTVYVGLPAGNAYTPTPIYPATAGAHFVPGGLIFGPVGNTSDIITCPYNWGIGLHDYDSAFNFQVINGAALKPYHLDTFSLRRCGLDTSVLNIP